MVANALAVSLLNWSASSPTLSLGGFLEKEEK
jgi:hypothetical protein